MIVGMVSFLCSSVTNAPVVNVFAGALHPCWNLLAKYSLWQSGVPAADSFVKFCMGSIELGDGRVYGQSRMSTEIAIIAIAVFVSQQSG